MIESRCYNLTLVIGFFCCNVYVRGGQFSTPNLFAYQLVGPPAMRSWTCRSVAITLASDMSFVMKFRQYSTGRMLKSRDKRRQHPRSSHIPRSPMKSNGGREVVSTLRRSVHTSSVKTVRTSLYVQSFHLSDVESFSIFDLVLISQRNRPSQ